MIKAAASHAFLETDPTKPKNTSAIIVVHDGRIIAEQYAQGVKPNDRLMGWSMTKSITNALIGILVHDGKLNIDAPAPVSEWTQTTEKRSL